MMTGMSSIQWLWFISLSTAKPSMTGMTMSSRISAMPVSYCSSMARHSLPFPASRML